MVRRPSSKRPILCAVLDAAALGERPRSFAAALFAAGVDWIQLRDRGLHDERLFQLAVALVSAREDAQEAASATPEPSRPSPRVLVNRRIDVALAARADGVDLGFDALEASEARTLLGGAALIGASLHSLEEIEATAGSGLDYAHLAPIWDPISKPASRPALGLELLSLASAVGLPLLAQGGVDPARCAAAVAAGAAGIAATGSLSGADAPIAVAARLRRGLDDGN